jgi:putative heme iron utilization protein
MLISHMVALCIRGLGRTGKASLLFVAPESYARILIIRGMVREDCEGKALHMCQVYSKWGQW